MIDHKGIWYLSEAVRLGTIRAAADCLNIEPSSISRRITKLEKKLGITLIERHQRGVRSTQAGEALLSFHRIAGLHESTVLAEIDELRGLSRGCVSVIMGEGFVGGILSDHSAKFFADYPGITIDLEVAETNSIIRKIVDDEAEIGLVFNPPKDTNLRSIVSIEIALCAVMPATHVLANRTQLSLKNTAEYPLALLRASFGIRQLLAKAEAAHQIRLKPNLVTDSIAALKSFVRAGVGLTYLPSLSVTREVDDGAFAAIPLSEPELQSVTAQIVVRNGRQLSPSAIRFLSYFTRSMSAFKRD